MSAWCSASRATRRFHFRASGEALQTSENIDMLGSKPLPFRADRCGRHLAGRVLEPGLDPPFAWGEARGHPTTERGTGLDFGVSPSDDELPRDRASARADR